MNPSPPLKINFQQIVDTLKNYRWLWIAPTVVMTLGSVAAAFLLPPKWSALQSFLVRDEAGNNMRGLGKFDSVEAMKTAQETIQELARNRTSVETVLKLVGPPATYRNPELWPTPDDVTAAQAAISVGAPNGTEFGKSEVIYVSTKGESRERAMQLTTATGDELEKRLREFRQQKLRSIVEELEKRSRAAETERDAAAKRLQAFETRIGGDVGDLRSFTESNEGGSGLRNQQIAIRNDIRQANTQRESLLQLQELIETARKDPENFLATPSRLLDAQPGLRKTKEALVEMQAMRAKLSGMMNPEHPRVKEAEFTELEMRESLYREFKESARGVASDLKANAAQIRSLENQLTRINNRLDQLAGSRTEYVNLASEAKRCNETLEKTNRELSDARAALSGALTASLISRLDNVVAGDRPIGPGKSMIIVGGFGAGLATGLGLVFLIAPIGTTGRRISDFIPLGRRASDRGNATRRTTDPLSAAQPRVAPVGRRLSDPPPPPTPLTGNPAASRRADDFMLVQRQAEAAEMERRRGRRNEDLNPPATVPPHVAPMTSATAPLTPAPMTPLPSVAATPASTPLQPPAPMPPLPPLTFPPPRGVQPGSYTPST